MVTDDSFVNFLLCRRKASLKGMGASGEQPDIERVLLDIDRLYRWRGTSEWLAPVAPADVMRDPIDVATAVKASPKFIVNAMAEAGGLRARIQLAERVDGLRERGSPTYSPVLFVAANKVSRQDKLLLAFHALTLAVAGKEPSVARIVHGDERKVLRVKVASLADEVRRLVAEIEAARAATGPPPVILNRHCNACEFQAGCRTAAEEADDLSRLRGLLQPEMDKLRARGVSTVIQYSHTYRPGRRGKRKTGKARKHDHALQAAAIRDGKVYVLDNPAVPRSGVALYLDVEGVPDRDFYYLIGLVAVRDGACTAYTFWADDPAQEKAMWDNCARVIEGHEEYMLYHYGSYESRFFDRMRQAADAEGAAVVDRIRARSCNVLAAIYSHVYFPTYSNGLKDIAAFLGFRWSAANASGIQSLAWRLGWEASSDESLKQELVRYNQEDCLALRRVTEFVQNVSAANRPQEDGSPAVTPAADIESEGGYRFGKPTFVLPELDQINGCAYSDYQREKVYLRTCPAMRRSLRRKRRAALRPTRVNAEFECPRPECCPECGSRQVHTFYKPIGKTVFDLKFSGAGVKRWVTRYRAARWRCWRCRASFLPESYRSANRLGDNLASWAVFHHVALRQSYEDVNLAVQELFGRSFGYALLNRIMPRAAEYHRDTYERLKERLRRGGLIHADETRVRVFRGDGYVWAFANMEEIVYTYTPTREGTILNGLLDGFQGVLVSDFYSAYDAPGCAQQKCLIHLIRDINDDLFHAPFDEELKEVARRFVAVLKPVVETVDRYGLKRYHMHKHQEAVGRFFRFLSSSAFGSEAACKYRRRMLKYESRLFTFLGHDGVPWNNNNAENAIKHFAGRRKILGSGYSAKSLQDFLLFFSIYQTCRNKGLSFLRFLRSGLTDIDAFGGGARHPKP